MKMLFRFAAVCGLFLPLMVSAVVFTSDTTINVIDTNYDGSEIVVSNSTLTINGPHTFANLLIGAGGKLTYSFRGNGQFLELYAITNEPYVMAGTNPVSIIKPNAVLQSVVVWDDTGTNLFTNNVDYIIILDGTGLMQLARRTNSSIPDGATVLVSYQWLAATVASGLNLGVTGDFTVAPGGVIDAMGGGYSNSFTGGRGGSLGNPASGGGGGNGGLGGTSSSNAVGGLTLGAYASPNSLGGAGGTGASAGGATGGGLIKIQCGGTFTLNGDINVSGLSATNARSGGGAGGSVWIVTTNFAGAGSIVANGGAGEPIHGGGGGGGRIALQFATNTFTGSLKAMGGAGWQAGGAGTLFVAQFGTVGWLTVDNGGKSGANTPLVSANGPNLTVQGKASANFEFGITRVGELLVRSNSVVLPVSTNLLTFSTVTVQSNLTLEATAKITATARGYSANAGPGTPINNLTVGAGAGHGGSGGEGILGAGTNAIGGNVYDFISQPTTPGSGGRTVSSSIGGTGGGVVVLNVAQNFQLDGEVSANATAGTGDRAGGGSGGSVWITAGNLSGSGSISAEGGAGGYPYGGGGGGGRIVLNYTNNTFSGTLSARGGTGAVAGGAGSIYMKAASQSAAEATFDNGGRIGARSMYSDSGLLSRLSVLGGTFLMLSNNGSTFGTLIIGTNSSVLPALGLVNVSSNLTVAAGGAIALDGVYRNNNMLGSGGGGHAGIGGRGATSSGFTGAVDNVMSPVNVGGSGGFGVSSLGGFGYGGGVLKIVAGALLLDGIISARGTDAVTNYAGGGAGGSITLTVGDFAGAGLVTVDGGSGCAPFGGGGGGGCIALTCTTPNNSFAGRYSASGGNGFQRGGAGTVYLKRTSLQSVPDVIVDNGGIVGTNTLMVVSNLNAYNLEIKGGAWAASLSTVPMLNLLVRSNSWLNSTSAIVVAGDAIIEPGGGINLNGIGNNQTGIGGGKSGGGGGHGGYGGGSSGGTAYDSMTLPALAGAPGDGTGAGLGGGFLNLTVQGTLQADGRISADGVSGIAGTGAGSGGSLRLTLNRLAGNGSISASGGTGIPLVGGGGGGGGGRIAITCNSNLFTGLISAAGGAGAVNGGAGTVYLKDNNLPLGMLLVDNAGFWGTNTPLSSAFGLPTNFNLKIGNGANAFFGNAPVLLSNLTVNAGGKLLLVNTNPLSLVIYGDLTIDAGAAMVADGRGFVRGINTGAGASLFSKGSGGGHGGEGGASGSGAAGGGVFDLATEPIGLGGVGGAGANTYVAGSQGGGALKLAIQGTATIDGNLTANGNPGLQDDSGGGAGGSIWLVARALAGSGVIAADGGDGELYGGGGGGGGRIALYAKFTNAFTGIVSVLGGEGANAGQSGSIVFSTNLPPFAVTSVTPTGSFATVVSTIDFVFNQNIVPSSFSSAAISLSLPSDYSGPLPAITTSVSGNTGRVTVTPSLNVAGTNLVIVAPTVTDSFGAPLTTPFTNVLILSLSKIEGFVRDFHGNGAAGVVVATDGLLPTVTDLSGFYSLGVSIGRGWVITPQSGANMFVPRRITTDTIFGTITNQNFVLVPTLLPDVNSVVAGPNLQFNWTGFSSVTYQAYTSSNLVDWVPWGAPLAGTNAPMQLEIPVGTDAQSFFRLGASN